MKPSTAAWLIRAVASFPSDCTPAGMSSMDTPISPQACETPDMNSTEAWSSKA